MCFSPTISFVASAGLVVIGIATLKQTRTRREMALAAVPLLFAAQQFIEGMIWLSLLYERLAFLQPELVPLYSAFAGILWPLFITLSLWLIEPEKNRRAAMLAVGVMGLTVALYTVYVIAYFDISVEIAKNCILYDNAAPQNDYMVPFYVVATCAAFFLSSLRSIQWLGLMNMCMFLIAYYLYRTNLVSVWCFFAAVISGLIYGHFTEHSPRLFLAKVLQESFNSRRK